MKFTPIAVGASLVGSFFASHSRGNDAVMVWQSGRINLAIEGVNGYIPAPSPAAFLPAYQVPPHEADAVEVAADSHNVYLLSATGALRVTRGGSSYVLYDQLSVYDYSSPVPLRTISLPAGVRTNPVALDGVVYTIAPAGQLYATNPNTGSTSSIGTVYPAINQMPISTPPEYQWSLHAHPNVGLLAASAPSVISTVSVVDRNTAAVIRSHTLNSFGLPDMLSIDSAGTFARFTTGSYSADEAQRRMDLPGLFIGSELAPKDQFTDVFAWGDPTDDVDFTLTASMPPLVQIGWHLTSPAPEFALYRRPRTIEFTAEVDVDNYVLPPGMTVTNVRPWISAASAGGPGLIQNISEPVAMPTLTLGKLGTSRIHINLVDDIGPGEYYVNFSTGWDSSRQAAGDITVGGTTTRNVPLQGPASGISVNFAYDPVSENLIGNGSFAMGLIGWSGDGESGSTSSSDRAIILRAFSESVEVSQILELPLASGPMRFSADLETYLMSPWSGTTAPVLILLINGVEEGRWAVDDRTAVRSLQADIYDPAFFGRTGADFRLKIVSSDYITVVALDNLSLVAIPEPHLPLYGALAVSLLRPRRRRRISNIG